MNNNYPRLSQLPYHNTKVSVQSTKATIQLLLEKYDITSQQWTSTEEIDNFRFFVDIVRGEYKFKLAVQFDIPTIKAIKGRRNIIVDVPKETVWRIIYYSLKSLLESTKYGIFSKEDIFLSRALIRLPNNNIIKVKELVEQKYLELPEVTIEEKKI